MPADDLVPGAPLGASAQTATNTPATPYGQMDAASRRAARGAATQIHQAAHATDADDFIRYLRQRVDAGLITTVEALDREFDFALSLVDRLDPSRIAGLLQSDHVRRVLNTDPELRQELEAVTTALLRSDLRERIARDLLPHVRLAPSSPSHHKPTL